MKRFFLLIALLPLFCFSQSEHVSLTHYTIYATLNDTAKTITGFEKIIYKNNTSQAQNYIWIRLYPNAYANDRTAYSEYLLRNGDTRFYFSNKKEKGGINQLNFQSHGENLRTEFDSSQNDKIKVWLVKPLQSGDSVEIATPFFVKLPYNFSGFGYNKNSLQLKNWYPAIAFYENGNWSTAPFETYPKIRDADADFDVTIIANVKDTLQTMGMLVHKDEGEDLYKQHFVLYNSKGFEFSVNDNDKLVAANLVSESEKNFDKLIPNIFQNKRPENSNATQQAISEKVNGIDSSSSKSLKSAFLFNLKETDKYHYLSFLPSVGYNNYDKAMVGIMIHNYQLPLDKFNFLLAPMYATNSKSLAGVGRIEYNIWQPKKWWQFSLSGERFSMDDFDEGNGETLFQQVRKIVPSIKYTIYTDNNRTEKWNFLLRAFILKEDALAFYLDADSVQHAKVAPMKSNILEFRVGVNNSRALYPYSANITVDATKDFIRTGFTGNCFFNYDASGKGLNARFFAGKFIYLKTQTPSQQFADERYDLNLSAPTGAEDYTYSNYFVGRNEYNGWMSQQIMERDGFFKVSTPQLASVVGQSDNWLTALNLTADIPEKINPLSVLPFKIPLKAFLDIGTYSGAWQEDPVTGRFLYDAGLQVSLLHSAVNIYLPFLYSKVYRDYYTNTMGYSKQFVHTIKFSIDFGKLKPKVLHKILPL